MSIWSCRPVGSYRHWRWPHDGHDHRNPVPPDGGVGQDAARVRGHGPDLHGGTQRRQLPAVRRGGPVVRRRDRRPTGTGLDGGGDPRTLRTLPSADRRADRPEVGGGPAGGARPHPGPDRRAATAPAADRRLPGPARGRTRRSRRLPRPGPPLREGGACLSPRGETIASVPVRTMTDQETTKPATQGSSADADSAGAGGPVAPVDTGWPPAAGVGSTSGGAATPTVWSPVPDGLPWPSSPSSRPGWATA